MRNLLKCSVLLLLFAASLLAQTAPAPAPSPVAQALPPGAPSQELLDAYFKRTFGYDTNLQVKVLGVKESPIAGLFDVTALLISPDGQQLGHWFVSNDGQHVVVGDILPFGADPYKSERDELAKSAFGPTKGPADAKMLIVEFADLECPACKEFAPNMAKLRADFPNARFIFQSLPLVQLHPWAKAASSYLDCIARANNDQAFVFMEAVFSHQKEIDSEVRRTDPAGKTEVVDALVNEQLGKYVEWAGADPAKVRACAELPATADRIAKSTAFAQSMGVTSTPTLFINGRRLANPGGVQYEALKAVAQFESEQAAAGK